MPTQVLISGKDTLYKYINDKFITYNLSYEVNPDVDQPYFFRNYLIDGKVYLACNMFNKQELINSVIYNWTYYKVNSEFPEHDEYVPYGVYYYVSPNDITFHKGETNHSMVLVYLIDSVPNYTVLLKLV
jgi:hypothetical protein